MQTAGDREWSSGGSRFERLDKLLQLFPVHEVEVAALAAHQTVCTVTSFQGPERILDFHRIIPSMMRPAFG